MIAVNETLAAMADRFADNLMPADRQDINDVLDAAADWAAGRMPLEVFAAVGFCLSPATEQPSNAYSRYLAMVATHPTDPRLGDLKRAIDALIRFQGFVITTKGIFAPAEIPDVVIRREAA